MKIYTETSLDYFEAWSGGENTLDRVIKEGKVDELEAVLKDLYPDGIDETALNDILRFESDWVYEMCGIRSESQIREELEETKEEFAELMENYEDECDDEDLTDEEKAESRLVKNESKEECVKVVTVGNSDYIFENLEECYNNPTNLEAREKMLLASYNAGVAFTKSYVGYVHAIAHSLGGKYNIPHGLANAVILPYVLRKYGRKIYNKLWEMGVYSGLFNNSVSKEVGAKIFIEHIEKMNKNMNIPTSIKEIDEQDISALAIIAEHEANPLYPVPVLYTASQLEQIYREVKNG